MRAGGLGLVDKLTMVTMARKIWRKKGLESCEATKRRSRGRKLRDRRYVAYGRRYG